ncbi:hypothetical protein H0H93_013103 [Arthromyces matolae]|nr:hypothetical protein H0H93_013103 [Arthromyces matolae]
MANQSQDPVRVEVKGIDDAEILVKLNQDAAQGRDALAENVVLTSSPSSSSKKKKGKSVPGTDSQMKDDPAGLMKKFEVMELELCELRAENRQFREENRQLREDNRQLREDNCQLKKRVAALEKSLHKLDRQIILDQARDRLLQLCQLNRYQFRTPELLLAAVKKGLPASTPKLSDEALDLIFLPSRIRDEGLQSGSSSGVA